MTDNLRNLLNQLSLNQKSPSPSNDPLVGSSIGPDYKVLQLLGQGAMAKVYKARQVGLDRFVAIKGLTTDAPELVARFIHEIKVHSKLQHTNIVEALDCITVPSIGQTFFVMEYLDGVSLAQIIKANPSGLRSANDVVFILTQTLVALEYAHRQGVIHRDLKPANLVLVNARGELRVKVVDFGMARLQEQMQRFTKTGHIVGSPLYMSPEQCVGKELDNRSDVYAAGLLAYELLTGNAPYTNRNTLYEVMQAHCEPDTMPPLIGESNKDIRLVGRLDAIIRTAIQTRPKERFQSAKALSAAIEHWHTSVLNNVSEEMIAKLPIELGDSSWTKSVDLTPPLAVKRIIEDAPAQEEPAEKRLPSLQAPASKWRLPERLVTQGEQGWDHLPGQQLNSIEQCEPMYDKTIDQRYKVLDLLGVGGMSLVYRALQIDTDKFVAVKTLKFLDEDLAKRFAREIKIHSELRHPNIVKAIDHLILENQAFFVMEIVSGLSLDDFLEKEMRVESMVDLASILAQILDALEYAHDRDVIHRDLKPGNVMLTEQQGNLRVRVLDFGLAKIEADLQRLTRTGVLIGSPAYMSPEHCRGLDLTKQSDLYSFGILMYELATGELPYEVANELDMISAHCEFDVVPVASRRPDMPNLDGFQSVVLKALAKDKKARFAEVDEVRQALDQWWRGSDLEPEASPFKSKRRRRRRLESDTKQEAKAPAPAPVDGNELSGIVGKYQQSRVDAHASRFRESPFDSRSLKMVSSVVVIVFVFLALGSAVFFFSRQPPSPPVEATETAAPVPTASTDPSREERIPQKLETNKAGEKIKIIRKNNWKLIQEN